MTADVASMYPDSAILQEALLNDAETEAIRPGRTRRWNPDAAGAYLAGVAGTWHAVPCRWAEPAITQAARTGSAATVPAACGQVAMIAPAHGTYNRTQLPVAGRPCPACAWQLAIETGSTGREIALMIPGRRTADALARTGADPMLVSRICQAILAAASDDEHKYELDHPAVVQLLAYATAHQPVLLVAEACSSGECEGHAAEVQRSEFSAGGGAASCEYPDAEAACGACSLLAGGWAGEWEGDPPPECTVAAPCGILTTLARHYKVPLRPF